MCSIIMKEISKNEILIKQFWNYSQNHNLAAREFLKYYERVGETFLDSIVTGVET